MKRTITSRARLLLPAGTAAVLALTYAGCSADESPGADERVGESTQHLVSNQACLTVSRTGATGMVWDTQIKNAPLSATTQNFNSSQTMNTGPLNGAVRQSLLQFDLSQIPAGPGTHITNAYVQLAEGLLAPSGPSTIDVHRVTAPWNEGTVTWGSFQESYDPTVYTTFSSFQNGKPNPFPIFNVPSLVQGWVDGTVPNHGVLLEDPSTNATNFWTSEYGTASYRPELHVCFTVACSAGHADCNGNGLDGCETNLGTSAANCGACGNACPSGQVCQNGACAVPCPPSFGSGSYRTFTGNGDPQIALAADLNGDGKADIFTTNDSEQYVAWLVDPTGSPSAANRTTGLGPGSAAIADLNGDGKPDAVVGAGLAQSVYVLYNNGGNGAYNLFSAPTVYGQSDTPYAVAVADVNGDGHPDIVLALAAGGALGVMLNRGDGTFVAPVTYPGAPKATALAVGDLNGDGLPDVAVVGKSGSNVSVYLNQGGGVFGMPALVPWGGTTVYGAGTLAVSDLNGDGKPDLAVVDYGTSNVSVLLNQGGGAFAAPVTYAAGGGNPQSMTVLDANGDGHPDLAVANTGASTVSLLLNQGNGTFAAPQSFAASSPIGISAGDVNGDGKPDLVIGTGQGSVGWFLNQACASGVCGTGGICQAASCTDGVKNGGETGVDCGGGCSPCAAGQGCLAATDCASGVCTGGVCQAASCSDGIKNGTETSADCGGGACPACAASKGCVLGSDCASGICDPSLACQAASCSDGIKNGTETDVDCGGGCSPCAVGQFCVAATDCASGVCTGFACQAPAPATAACASGNWTSTSSSIGVVPASPALDFGPGSSFSVALWASISQSGHLLVKGDNSTNEWSFTHFNGQLCFNRQGLANLACAAAPSGGWHHYAATYAAGAVTLYVDGAPIGAGMGQVGNPQSTVLNVGTYAATGGAIVGQMNDVALWGQALTAAQIQGLYKQTSTPASFGNLVAEWPLNDGTGTSAADSTGHGHTMTLGNVGWSNTCYDPPVCASGNWTSTTSSVGTVQPSPALNFGPGSSFSAAFWASLSPATFQHLLVKGDNSTNEWSFVYTGSQLCFARQGLAFLACAPAPTGAWHHYAATYAGGAVTLYVDGAPIAAGNGQVGSPQSTVLYVGNYATGGAGIVGQMDDLALWGQALTAAQIQALYKQTSTPAGFSNLVAEWPLNDGTGTTATDSTGHGHTMTLGNVGWSNTCYSQPATASLFGYTSAPTTTHRNDGPYTVGSLFQVGSKSITLTALGVQDDGSSGPNTDGFLTASLPVGLWDATGTTLLASVSVQGTDPLTGGYRYHALAAPITLQANTKYLIGAVVGAGFEWFDDSNNNMPVFYGLGGITLVSSQFNPGGTLAAPTSVSPGPAGRYGAASALFY